MASMGFVIALTLFLQAQEPTATVPVEPTAVDVLRGTLKAIEKADSVEYEVRRVAKNPEDQDAKLRTIILAKKSPFQFYAKTVDENGQVVGLAVSDGKMTRTSAAGKIGESPTFTIDRLMIATMRADEDLAITLELFNPGSLNEAIASQRISLAGQIEIEGELCHTIFYARPTPRPGLSLTRHIWVSATTGLPRAVQTLNLSAGNSILSPRLVISKIRLNPAIPPETFAYQPKASDSVAAPSAPPASAEAVPKSASGEPAAAIGKQLPDLDVRDVRFRALNLANFKGKPTIITFWASWCGPCVKEMPTLQKLLDEYKGRLQTLAIAVQEDRRSSMRFIKDHPQYKFIFLTEPTADENGTPLQEFFGIQGIPVGAFVDAQGKILDLWFGFKDEKEFEERIRRLMNQ
ncbi:MAG TPA: TlpA disulfide reductase family protein [Blastocatellia bacterium]|nr:TlpA disulfide reductase family protein [Blastocatellia bacterium]